MDKHRRLTGCSILPTRSQPPLSDADDPAENETASDEEKWGQTEGKYLPIIAPSPDRKWQAHSDDDDLEILPEKAADYDGSPSPASLPPATPPPPAPQCFYITGCPPGTTIEAVIDSFIRYGVEHSPPEGWSRVDRPQPFHGKHDP